MPGSDRWRVLILAAGRGTRMGGPKALMQVGGRPWWQLQEERLADTPRTWIVSPDVAPHLPTCTLITADPDAPMFSSIRAGLAAATTEPGLFILPVDVPAPAPSTLAALSRSARDGVAIPTYHSKRGHPVALSRAWITRVFQPAAHQDQRLDRLIAPDAIEVAVDDPDIAINLNTPQDVEQWLRR